MSLADFYFHDLRLVLIPIEHLCPDGMSAELAALLTNRGGWSRERIDLFDTAFSLYWSRSAALAQRSRSWVAPRIRHVAVILDPHSFHPYAQLLNTSAWTLFEADLDPASSHPEFAAYLLVHGDRMAVTGEVTMAGVHNAAYWFERTDEECARFADAARRSTRPDAAAFQALADALPWLRQLHHESLRPPVTYTEYRPIPHSGLLVSPHLQQRPPELVQRWASLARETVATFHARWSSPDLAAARGLCEWLAAEVPPVLVTGARERILWDPEAPLRLGAMRQELKGASGAGVRDVWEDLRVVDRKTRAFLAAVRDPAALPRPAPETEQAGYAYIHRERGLISYDLHEPHTERLRGPHLPYARAMLGARCAHEWAHLATDAGWVPAAASDTRLRNLSAALAAQLDEIVEAAPRPLREQTSADLAALAQGRSSVGTALVQIALARLPDFQANLLAARFLEPIEQETYVRQNIRSLRADYPPAQLWRMLVRYLYEYQYLRFSRVSDPRTYFLRSTWFDQDYFHSMALDGEQFDALAATMGEICAAYAVDERRFR